MKKTIKIIVCLLLVFMFIPPVNGAEQDNLKVLIIEIDPVLQTVPGKPRVSSYFRQSIDAGINEMKKDLEFSSHNYLKVEIVDRIHLNEFPTYKTKVTLSNGSEAYRYDEATYLEKAGYDGTANGNWYTLYQSGFLDQPTGFVFDYDYILNKYDLINRRKNGDFDQIWIFTIDPASTYETIMIGRNPFWINAPGYVKDCPNFQIAAFAISRRDANLHALGHGVEGTLNAVFSKNFYEYDAYNNSGKYKYYYPSYSSYEKDVIDITSENYDSLNVWEKFMLGTYSNKSNYSSAGNVHYPFNGEADYDYTNTNKVYTNWREWLNYPNVKANFVLDNNNAWLTNAGNDSLGDDEEKNPDRLFMRFWLYLMPHVDGYTSDGHYNNWWKYFKSLDFVTEITPKETEIKNLKVGEKVDLSYVLKYNSGEEKTINNPNVSYDNYQISGNSIKKEKNYLVATSLGKSELTINHDGVSTKVTLNVEREKDPVKEEKKDDNPKTNISFPLIATIITTSFVLILYYIIKKKKVLRG